MKALYLSTFEIAKKWTMPIRNWGKVRGELEIMFPDNEYYEVTEPPNLLK